MSVGKGFLSGFGGCLGVGCAVVFVVVAIPIGCIMIGGTAVHQAQQQSHTLAEQSASSQGPTAPTDPAKHPAPAQPSEESAVDATREAAKQGDVQVRVTKVAIDFVPLKTFEESKSQDKLLVISLELTNNNPRKIVNHKGWGASATDFIGEGRASVKDDAGNQYKRCQFGIGTRVVGQVHGSESLYPNKTLADLVVFEPPIDACKHLILELPASAFGGEGVLRFKIPRSMWTGGHSSSPDLPKTSPAPATSPDSDKHDQEPAAGQPPEQSAVDATHESAKQGDVQVRVTKVAIDFVSLKTFEESTSKDKLLMVSLEISNGNSTKIVNHKGWGASVADFSGEDRASIKDDAGNEYKRCQFGIGTRVVGQVHGSESIYPNKTLADLVVFEPPIDACKYLILELPASAFGGEGKLRFNIPRSMWEGGGRNASAGSGSERPDMDSQRKAQEAEKERERRKELATQQDAARWHTWTSADGQHTIEAKFVKAVGDTVHLEKKDGTIIKIQRDKLSEDDWKWITNKSWTKGTK